MKFNPNYNLSQEYVEVNVSIENDIIKAGSWEVRTSPHIELRRGLIECGQDGVYDITFQTPKTNISFVFIVDIDKDTTGVELKFTEKENEYVINCTYRRECDPACIILLEVRNGSIGPLPNIGFICSDPVDWMVHCWGNIPKTSINLENNTLMCRPNITNQTEADYFGAVLPNNILQCNNITDCDFHCPKESLDDYFIDTTYCNIFHRCVNGTLYSETCSKGTFFSTRHCTCAHIDEVLQDRSYTRDGLRLETGNQIVLCRAHKSIT
ncbi:uncharacterized protein LOC144619190 [Crassostrea virginica]